MLEFLAWLGVPQARRIVRQRLAAEYVALAKAQLARMDADLANLSPEIAVGVRSRFLEYVGLTEQQVA